MRFITLPNVDRNKSIEAGCPIVLQCELSDPSAKVFWYKDEIKLLPHSGLDFQSNGTKRALVVEKADFFHSGVYSCKTKGAAVQFTVEIKGDWFALHKLHNVWFTALESNFAIPSSLLKLFKQKC